MESTLFCAVRAFASNRNRGTSVAVNALESMAEGLREMNVGRHVEHFVKAIEVTAKNQGQFCETHKGLLKVVSD